MIVGDAYETGNCRSDCIEVKSTRSRALVEASRRLMRRSAERPSSKKANKKWPLRGSENPFYDSYFFPCSSWHLRTSYRFFLLFTFPCLSLSLSPSSLPSSIDFTCARIELSWTRVALNSRNTRTIISYVLQTLDIYMYIYIHIIQDIPYHYGKSYIASKIDACITKKKKTDTRKSRNGRAGITKLATLNLHPWLVVLFDRLLFLKSFKHAYMYIRFLSWLTYNKLMCLMHLKFLEKNSNRNVLIIIVEIIRNEFIIIIYIYTK